MIKNNDPLKDDATLDNDLERVLSLGPHCTHKDYNHPNAWGTKRHIGHPNRNVVMKMIEQFSWLLE
jgi:hypothetical protein